MLSSTSGRPLHQEHDLVMLDLDGVVYVGPDAVPGAAEALGTAGADGVAIAYITNNASRTPSAVADQLRSLGMPGVQDGDVVTSAQAVAHLIADSVPSGSRVLVAGGEGLLQALRERDLEPVTSLDDDPVAVVQGFHPDLSWKELAEVSYAVHAGVPWFASNLDLTIPTKRGIAPGNGSLVRAVATATGAQPVVAGKPEAPLFRETVERCGGSRPLVVGDRLDTDIAGAAGIGAPSLAVLTGVSSLQDLADAKGAERPSFVARDLHGLVQEHPELEVDGHEVRCGQSVVRADDGRAVVVERGSELETLRAVVALAWTRADDTGESLAVDGTLDA